jgi:deoxyribonuclease-4
MFLFSYIPIESMKIGCHVSMADGVDKAVDRADALGCDVFQIFTRSPRMWRYRELREEEVSAFKRKRKETGIDPVFSHMPYLPNLSSSNMPAYAKSVDTLRLELTRCNQLGIPFLVTHLGSHLGKGLETGIKQIIGAIDSATEGLSRHPVILLENTSGKTNEVGSTFEEINTIIEKTTTDKIGVCFDTCHGFARGYDISNEDGVEAIIQKIEETMGLNKVGLVHMNDSKGELGSRMDRHNHIGLGYIGEDGFKAILQSHFGDKPMVLETPVNDIRDDKGNLSKLRELAG